MSSIIKNLDHAFPPFAPGLPSVYERAGFDVNPSFHPRDRSPSLRSIGSHFGTPKSGSTWSLSTMEAAKAGPEASTSLVLGFPPTPRSRTPSAFSQDERSTKPAGFSSSSLSLEGKPSAHPLASSHSLPQTLSQKESSSSLPEIPTRSAKRTSRVVGLGVGFMPGQESEVVTRPEHNGSDSKESSESVYSAMEAPEDVKREFGLSDSNESVFEPRKQPSAYAMSSSPPPPLAEPMRIGEPEPFGPGSPDELDFGADEEQRSFHHHGSSQHSKSLHSTSSISASELESVANDVRDQDQDDLNIPAISEPPREMSVEPLDFAHSQSYGRQDAHVPSNMNINMDMASANVTPADSMDLSNFSMTPGNQSANSSMSSFEFSEKNSKLPQLSFPVHDNNNKNTPSPSLLDPAGLLGVPNQNRFSATSSIYSKIADESVESAKEADESFDEPVAPLRHPTSVAPLHISEPEQPEPSVKEAEQPAQIPYGSKQIPYGSTEQFEQPQQTDNATAAAPVQIPYGSSGPKDPSQIPYGSAPKQAQNTPYGSAPQLGGAPRAPGPMPQMPQMPQMSGMPGMPRPMSPQIQNMPGMPRQMPPQMPGMPGMPRPMSPQMQRPMSPGMPRPMSPHVMQRQPTPPFVGMPRSASQPSIQGVPRSGSLPTLPQTGGPRTKAKILPAHSMGEGGIFGMDMSMSSGPTHYRPPRQLGSPAPMPPMQGQPMQGQQPMQASPMQLPQLQTQRLRKKPSIPMPSQLGPASDSSFFSPMSPMSPRLAQMPPQMPSQMSPQMSPQMRQPVPPQGRQHMPPQMTPQMPSHMQQQLQQMQYQRTPAHRQSPSPQMDMPRQMSPHPGAPHPQWGAQPALASPLGANPGMAYPPMGHSAMGNSAMGNPAMARPAMAGNPAMGNQGAPMPGAYQSGATREPMPVPEQLPEVDRVGTSTASVPLELVSSDVTEPDSAVLAEPVSALSTGPASNESLDFDDARRPKSSKKVCRGCEDIIEGKSIRSKDGNLSGRWHRQCFCCTRCADPLEKDVYVKDDNPFCQKCYHVVNKSVCRMCGGGVEGTCLETRSEGNDGTATLYHSDCLRCVECQVQLSQSYFEVDGATYCAEHAFSSLPPDAKMQARFTRFIMI